MLRRFPPESIDNSYRGQRLALWLFAPLVLVKGAIGLGTMSNGQAAATAADGNPLETFGSAGQQAFLAIFAAWGLAQLVLNLIGVPVLVRYRALLSFMGENRLANADFGDVQRELPRPRNSSSRRQAPPRPERRPGLRLHAAPAGAADSPAVASESRTHRPGIDAPGATS